MNKKRKQHVLPTGPKWLQQDRQDGSTPETVKEQEAHSAKIIDGRCTPASGAKGIKGDSFSDDLNCECKQTANLSIGMKLKWLCDIEAHALAAKRDPILHLRFLRSDRSTQYLSLGRPTMDWVVMPEWYFRKLRDDTDK